LAVLTDVIHHLLRQAEMLKKLGFALRVHDVFRWITTID